MNIELLKLYRKAFSLVPGSLAQKKVLQQIDEVLAKT